MEQIRWLLSKEMRKDLEKLEPSYTVDESVIDTAIMETGEQFSKN